MNQAALSDIRVVDFTHYTAGPYCTKLLAGFGAEVIKVERPQTGDAMRSCGPFMQNAKDDLETSIPFLWLNTGKKSVTLDLKTETGRQMAKELIRGADVLVENFSPGVMQRLGLDYQAVQDINPGIIMTSISNFGQSGPYKDYQADEITLNALSGGMSVTGDPDKEPLAAGPSLYQYTAGQHAYIGTLMALFQKGDDGRGQFVDVSIQESGLEHIEIALTYNLQKGENRKRGGHMFVPWNTYDCQDGQAVVIAMPYRHWHRAAEIFNDPALFDKKYDHLPERIKNRDEYEARLRPCVKALRKKDLFHAGQKRGLAFGYIASLEEAARSPQHQDRNFFTELHHPRAGSHPCCNAPFQMSATPWTTLRSPLLGEHNADIYQGLLGHGSRRNQSIGRTENHMKRELPLTGIRVLDLSHSWAAPHCGRILADFGAEVIKIEYIKRLCLLRGARKDPQIYNQHPGWLQVNRNKYAITLDLQAVEDREVFTDLVKITDVVITNFRPGSMEKLGLGYEDITRIKDDVIFLSMSSFGDTGPYAHYAGYGAVFEALGGINSLTAYDRDSRPCRIKEIDVTNGSAGAGAVMTALIHRRKTGQGQYIDLSQLEAATHATIGEHLLAVAMNADQTLPRGNRHWKYAPQGCYRCRGQDKWVVITVRTEAEWERFCEVAEHPEWKTDERFASLSDRMANHDKLDKLINQWTGTRENIEIMERLQANNICAGAVLDVDDLGKNPHLEDRGYFAAEKQSPDTRFPGMPFALSESPGKVAWRGPALGRHNEHILCHLLGRSPEEVTPIKESEVGTAFDK